MARLGIPPHVADKILNHQAGTISGVAAVYQRHDFLAERKEALDRWGGHVGEIVRAEVRAADLNQRVQGSSPCAPTTKRSKQYKQLTKLPPARSAPRKIAVCNVVRNVRLARCLQVHADALISLSMDK